MAVQDEMLPRRTTLEAAHDIGHRLLGGDHAMREREASQIVRDEGRCLTRVAWRVGAPGANETLEEINELLTFSSTQLASFFLSDAMDILR
jgi:hypothetical protein